MQPLPAQSLQAKLHGLAWGERRITDGEDDKTWAQIFGSKRSELETASVGCGCEVGAVKFLAFYGPSSP